MNVPQASWPSLAAARGVVVRHPSGGARGVESCCFGGRAAFFQPLAQEDGIEFGDGLTVVERDGDSMSAKSPYDEPSNAAFIRRIL